MAPRGRRKQGCERSINPGREKATSDTRRLSKKSELEEYPLEYRNGWWPIERICEEDESRYLIQWKRDPVTRIQYPREWKEKGDVTQAAIDEWEAFQIQSGSRSSSRAFDDSDATQRSNDSDLLEPPRKRRRVPRRPIVWSSPSSTPSSHGYKDNRPSKRFSEVEIQETQDRSTLRAVIEVQIPTWPSLLNRDEYTLISSSAYSSQNTNPETLYIPSSKETDYDSAISLASPLSEDSPNQVASIGSIRSSTLHSIPALYNDDIQDSIGQEEALELNLTDSGDAVSQRSEDGFFYPEFRPNPRSPEVASENRYSPLPFSPLQYPRPAFGINLSLRNHTDKPRQEIPSSYTELLPSLRERDLRQGATVRDSQPSSSISQPDLAAGPTERQTNSTPSEGPKNNTYQYLSPIDKMIRNMANMPESSSSDQPQSASTSQLVPERSSLEIMSMANIGMSGSMDNHSSQNLPEKLLTDSILQSPMAGSSVPVPAAQTMAADFTNTGPPNDYTDDVLPTTELTSSMQVDSVLSPVSESDQASIRIPPLKLPSYQETKPRRFQRPFLRAPNYAVTLPAEGHMRHRYQEWFQPNDMRLLGKFVRNPSLASTSKNGSLSLSKKIDSFINQLKMATVHADFNINPRVYESMTQTVPEPSQEAIWAEMTSTKFAFLGKFTEEVRDENRRVVIIASTGQSIDTLETFFQGKRIPYRCFRGQGKGNVTSNVEPSHPYSFALLASDYEGVSESPLADQFEPEIVVDFEGSLDPKDSFVQKMQRSTRSETSAPVIHLIVVSSPQHIERCLAEGLSLPERMQHLVLATTHLRKGVGKFPIGFEGTITEPTQIDYDATEIAARTNEFEGQTKAIAACVVRSLRSDDFNGSWSLPPLPELNLIGLEATMAELDSYVDSPIAPKSRTGTPTGTKRTREQALTPGASKRLRTTPFQDTGHVSGTIERPHLQVENLRLALKNSEDTLASTLREKDQLLSSLDEKNTQLEDVMLSLSSLQHRYETQRKEIHRLRKGEALFESEKATRDARRDQVSAENAALREQRTQLQDDLRAARSALKEGGGTIAELESMREATEQLQKERDSLLKSKENMKKDFDFTRQQYQHASSAASDYLSQIREIEANIAKLQKEASDEKRRLRELNASEHEKQHRAAVTRLEDQVTVMEKLLMKKEEELERARRGRGVQTRAGSAQPQPGSPRLVGRGGESRGASPIPGLLGEGRLGHVHVGGGIGVSGGRASALRREG